MGLSSVHRSRIPLFREHNSHRTLRLSIPQECEYHCWACSRMYRCWRCRIHRWKHHHECTCNHILMVTYLFSYVDTKSECWAGYIDSRLMYTHPLFCLCWQFTVGISSLLVTDWLDETPTSVSMSMEAIGDITASAEVSRIPVEGKDFDSRIQGGLLVRLFMVIVTNYVLIYIAERWDRRICFCIVYRYSSIGICSGLTRSSIIEVLDLILYLA
jgi:hypothetical protein